MLSGRFQTTEGNVIEVFGVTGTDGQRYSISDLYLDVPDPNGITKQVRAGEVREQANNDWSEYKAIWFDNAQNKSWMGWGKRVARNVTGDHPLGLERPLKETKWFDFNRISNAEFNGEDFFTPLREALGTKLPQLQDTKQIIEGSSKAKALTKTLEVGVGEWLVQQIQKPDFDVNEVRRQLNKISNTFYSVDSQGTKKALLDVDQLEKNLFAYGEGTVPDAIRKKNVEALIQKNTNDIKSDVTKMQSGLRRAVNILSRLSPESKTGLDAADFLINGGPNVIDQVKQSLRKIPGKEKLSEEEIDEVIRLLYIDSVDNRIFVKTGTSEVSSMNPNGFTEVYDVDLSMLRDLVGFNNPEKAAVVKKVIGERRFNVYNRMIEFIENEQNQINQGLQLSGVPRRFSPEAWISRFYAMKRHVISPPYVGTEALLQTMRLNNFSMLKSILTDPDVGELFLEMVRTGKPLDKTRELQFAQALAATFVKGQAYLGKSEQDEVVDEYGRKFTISAGGFTTNSETLNFMRDDAKEYSRRASVRGPKNLEDQNQFLQLFNK